MGRNFANTVREHLKAIRQTKLYDLLAALPLIAWYILCAAHLAPSVVQQIKLIELFVRTDPSVLPPSLVLSTAARLTTLCFFAVLIFMFAVRHVPQRTARGLYPRCTAVVGTFLSVGIVLLPPRELPTTLYLVSFVLVITGTIFAIWAGTRSRAFD